MEHLGKYRFTKMKIFISVVVLIGLVFSLIATRFWSVDNDTSKSKFSGRYYGVTIGELNNGMIEGRYFRYRLDTEQRCDIYTSINGKDYWQTYILGQTTQNITEDLDKIPCGKINAPFVWLPIEYANLVKELKK